MAIPSVPGLRGADHVGLTVPDLEQAITFFTDVLGATLVYRMGPFVDDEGNWFSDELGLHPRSRVAAMALLRLGSGANLEVFQYESPGQRHELPQMSDWGGHHVAFYVDDIDAALANLREHGVTVLGQLKPGLGPEAGEGTGWVFFRSPWGLPLELVSYPNGRVYEATTTARLWNAAHPER
ncbi:VOC family protein [Acidothermaceae bacterium B102]|nr:VOC family protein [Acidothermaceae bacterium B102]